MPDEVYGYPLYLGRPYTIAEIGDMLDKLTPFVKELMKDGEAAGECLIETLYSENAEFEIEEVDKQLGKKEVDDFDFLLYGECLEVLPLSQAEYSAWETELERAINAILPERIKAYLRDKLTVGDEEERLSAIKEILRRQIKKFDM